MRLKNLKLNNSLLVLYACLIFSVHINLHYFWGPTISVVWIWVVSTWMVVIEFGYVLNAGGHGYSFVFPINIRGTTWWGKLMQNQHTLFKNEYLLHRRLSCVIWSGFSFENIPQTSFVMLQITMWKLFNCMFWWFCQGSFRVICKLHGLFWGHKLIFRKLLL